MPFASASCTGLPFGPLLSLRDITAERPPSTVTHAKKAKGVAKIPQMERPSAEKDSPFVVVGELEEGEKISRAATEERISAHELSILDLSSKQLVCFCWFTYNYEW